MLASTSPRSPHPSQPRYANQSIILTQHKIKIPIRRPTNTRTTKRPCRTCRTCGGNAVLPSPLTNIYCRTSVFHIESELRSAACANSCGRVATAELDGAGDASTYGQDGDVGVVAVEGDGGVSAGCAGDGVGVDGGVAARSDGVREAAVCGHG